MHIRLATTEDIPTLVHLGAKFYSQTEYYSAIEYSIDSASSLAAMCIAQGLFFVAEDNGKIVGILGGLAVPFLLNTSVQVGMEMFWYVEDKYRNRTIGYELLQAVERAAKDKGLKYWTMMCLESHAPEKVSSFYKSAGYRPVEHSFKKDL